MDTDTAAVSLAHFSDTHVGFKQYPTKSPKSGRNQREQDVLRAFFQVVENIDQWDPPLVIHAGDVAHRATVSTRNQLQIQEAFKKLSVRGDGSPRMVVVISGNHDMYTDPREPCFLEPTLRPLRSVAVVTNKYRQLDLARWVDSGEAPECLRNIVVHCLPHDVLKEVEWDEVRPVEGRVNILTSHGVVGNSELYQQCVGREYPVDKDVLLRGWDYVAMGHFHKPGPVAVGGLTEANTPIWYAGSTENCGFSDLRDGVGGRGYLRVSVESGKVPEVHKEDLPIRQMFHLPPVDADGLGPEDLTDVLEQRLGEADLPQAVVDQKVLNVPRSVWSLVDVAKLRRKASAALWYQLTPTFIRPGGDVTDGGEAHDDLWEVLSSSVSAVTRDEKERVLVEAQCRSRLKVSLKSAPGEGDDSNSPTASGRVPSAADDEELAAAS